jgi:hypothetical protein
MKVTSTAHIATTTMYALLCVLIHALFTRCIQVLEAKTPVAGLGVEGEDLRKDSRSVLDPLTRFLTTHSCDQIG